MRNFFAKMAEFMQGRYGNDKLNSVILIIAGVLYLINLFARNTILMLVILLLVGLVIYRALSKNVTKRLYENRRFTDIYRTAADFFKRQYMKIRDFKTAVRTARRSSGSKSAPARSISTVPAAAVILRRTSCFN